MKTLKGKNKLISFILLFLVLVSLLQGTVFSAFADVTYYSNVLTDLKKDAEFDETQFVKNETDYSLNLIQIAESEDKELFVYVYQPEANSGRLATSINIATDINGLDFNNYGLKYLNSTGVFFKYIVENFRVSSESERHYAITSIYRAWYQGIDQAPENDNIVDEVPFEVAKQFVFITNIDGITNCGVVDIETIEVTDKFCGLVRYPDGFKLYVGSCDSHFIAFNTDKPIDRLMEADVSYVYQSCYISYSILNNSPQYGEKISDKKTLSYEDKVTYNGGGIASSTYSWERIQSIEEFYNSVNVEDLYCGVILDVKTESKITGEADRALRGKKWVLRFVETSYQFHPDLTISDGMGGFTHIPATENKTLVGEETILRLKFETDGQIYNLGVIDNKQTGSGKPINEVTYEVSLSAERILKGILAWIILIASVGLGGVIVFFGTKLVILLLGSNLHGFFKFAIPGVILAALGFLIYFTVPTIISWISGLGGLDFLHLWS